MCFDSSLWENDRDVSIDYKPKMNHHCTLSLHCNGSVDKIEGRQYPPERCLIPVECLLYSKYIYMDSLILTMTFERLLLPHFKIRNLKLREIK